MHTAYLPSKLGLEGSNSLSLTRSQTCAEFSSFYFSIKKKKKKKGTVMALPLTGTQRSTATATSTVPPSLGSQPSRSQTTLFLFCLLVCFVMFFQLAIDGQALFLGAASRSLVARPRPQACLLLPVLPGLAPMAQNTRPVGSKALKPRSTHLLLSSQ